VRKFTEAQLTFGTELDPHGRLIGRDPRRMTQDELRAMGHEPMPVLKAMRAHCLDCCGGSASEVRMCVSYHCPQWEFRMGTNPFRKPASEAQRAQGRKLGARMRQKSAEALNLNGPENDEPVAGTGVGTGKPRDKSILIKPRDDDPRPMAQDEVWEMDPEPPAPLTALRARCLDCCGDSPLAVRNCMMLSCPQWAFRMGTNPFRKPASEAQRAQGRKLGARMRQKSAEALSLKGSENEEPGAGTGVGVGKPRDEILLAEMAGDDDGSQA